MGPFELVSGLKLYRNIQHGKNYPSVYTVMLDCIDVQPQRQQRRKKEAACLGDAVQPAIVPLTPGLCRVRSKGSGEFYFYCPSTGKAPCEPW